MIKIYEKSYLRLSVDDNNISHKHFSQLIKDIENRLEKGFQVQWSQDMLKICHRAHNHILNLTRRLFSDKVVQKKRPVSRRSLIDPAKSAKSSPSYDGQHYTDQGLHGKCSPNLAGSSILRKGFCYAR